MSTVGWIIVAIAAYAVVAPLLACAVGRRLRGQGIRYGHEFTCSKCGWRVYAPVHYGPRRVCLTCQNGFPDVERTKS